jgi:ABC-2 type transport system permease protein
VVATAVIAVVVSDALCALTLWSGIVVSGSSMSFTVILQAMGAGLAIVPFVVGLCLALVAWAPRAALPTITAGLSCTFIVSSLGPVLHWPNWLLALSPFHYLRAVPLQSPDWSGLLGLTLAGMVLGVSGATTFCRRDLQG